MGIFSKLFGRNNQVVPVDETQATELDEDIKKLEAILECDTSNVQVQQDLVAKYSKAASVFAQAPTYRGRVNDVFTRMNELRNMARTNF
ncbi:hypothetical protein [Vibrio methylphosphonaticus]|uniref:hypothetical protein n=1 Tax=Vibrio methylphosphonaticus TaxID=2946866 RepID=UPI00202A8C29|nr:hypothetical protein [Vibrio methylphosphonaticus]MCL9776847.1 hypothetical protein [Vibrio methylphosphonaticus]